MQSQDPLGNTQNNERHAPTLRGKRKVLAAGVVGNLIEWYDFALFGYFAPILSSLFFPNENAIAALLQTYSVFAAGFVMRPLGSVVFGYIGDRIGRREALFLSVILMAIPTFLLGILPDYSQVGIAAPILLTLLRLVQGFSVGGEYTGSATYLAEQAPDRLRAFTVNFTEIGSNSGILLGSGVATLMTLLLPETTLLAGAWRLPFLFGGLLGICGLYVRSDLPESEIFEGNQVKNETPLLKAVQQNGLPIVLATLFSAGHNTVFYIVTVYLPTYLTQVRDVILSRALLINTVAIAVLLAVTPLVSWLSDRTLRRKPLLLIGVVGLAFCSYPAFLVFNQGDFIWVWVVQIGLAAISGFWVAIFPTLLLELFPTEVRVTGYSLSYNLGVAMAGGTAPLIATGLIELTRNVYAPAIYLTGMIVVAAIALSFMPDRSREPLI